MQKLKEKLVDSHRTCADFRIVFIGNFVIKNLIDCNNTVDYIRFMTGKIIVENVITLDAEIFAIKKGVNLVLEAVEVNGNDTQKKIALLQLNMILVLL